MKKALLNIGILVSVATPVVAVISCSEQAYVAKKEEIALKGVSEGITVKLSDDVISEININSLTLLTVKDIAKALRPLYNLVLDLIPAPETPEVPETPETTTDETGTTQPDAAANAQTTPPTQPATPDTTPTPTPAPVEVELPTSVTIDLTTQAAKDIFGETHLSELTLDLTTLDTLFTFSGHRGSFIMAELKGLFPADTVLDFQTVAAKIFADEFFEEAVPIAYRVHLTGIMSADLTVNMDAEFNFISLSSAFMDSAIGIIDAVGDIEYAIFQHITEYVTADTRDEGLNKIMFNEDFNTPPTTVLNNPDHPQSGSKLVPNDNYLVPSLYGIDPQVHPEHHIEAAKALLTNFYTVTGEGATAVWTAKPSTYDATELLDDRSKSLISAYNEKTAAEAQNVTEHIAALKAATDAAWTAAQADATAKALVDPIKTALDAVIAAPSSGFAPIVTENPDGSTSSEDSTIKLPTPSATLARYVRALLTDDNNPATTTDQIAISTAKAVASQEPLIKTLFDAVDAASGNELAMAWVNAKFAEMSYTL